MPGPNRDGIIPNGWIEHSRTTLNAVITFRSGHFCLRLCFNVCFRCYEGMKFEGLKQQAVCKDDGLWSIPTPRCLAPCLVPSIAHGEAEAKLGEKIGHGESLAINCTDNYEVSYNILCYHPHIIYYRVLAETFLSLSLSSFPIHYFPISRSSLRSSTRGSRCCVKTGTGVR